jgi:hypothetical protein
VVDIATGATVGKSRDRTLTGMSISISATKPDIILKILECSGGFIPHSAPQKFWALLSVFSPGIGLKPAGRSDRGSLPQPKIENQQA